MLVDDRLFRRLCLARSDLDRLDHDGRVPSVAMVARRASLSPFQFIRQFDAVFGDTPHQYRRRKRLDRARVLLTEEGLSVTDVCLEVGFSSLGSFSTLFRDRFGEPPTAFRRRARGMVQVPGRLPAPLFPGCLGLMALLPDRAFRNSREASLPPAASH
jgi:AraC-like DNA-binding protein